MQIDEAVIKAAIWRYGAAQRYWRSRRSKAPATIAWWIDPALLRDYGAVGLARWNPSGPVIVLAWMPQNLEDACTVCHEIDHFCQDAAGYPSLGCKPTSPAATQRLAELGNGVLDLPINDRLRAMGFVISPPAAGPNPFDRLAREMGYQTPEQQRAVMQRIVDDHPGAVADGLHMTPDRGAFFKKEYERLEHA